jgi:hypothetical protein
MNFVFAILVLLQLIIFDLAASPEDAVCRLRHHTLQRAHERDCVLSIVAPALEELFIYVVVGSHLALLVYLIYLYCYRQFLANWLNTAIQSFSVYVVIMDFAYKLSGTTNPIVFHIIMWIFMAVAAEIAFTFDHFQETVMKDTIRADADPGERRVPSPCAIYQVSHIGCSSAL